MGRMTKQLGDQSTKGQESRLGEISGDQVTEDMVKVIQDRYLLHEGQINALRDRFRFNPGFPLKDRLRDALRRYESFSLIKDHDVTTERTENRLRELERRCAALVEAIEKLPHRAELLLNDQGFDDYHCCCSGESSEKCKKGQCRESPFQGDAQDEVVCSLLRLSQ